MGLSALLSVEEQRVAFSIFSIDIYWYGVIIVTGMALAVVIAGLLLKKRGYNPDLVIDLALAVFVLAIVGARLYYVAFTPGLTWTFAKIFDVRSGGLAFYGGLIGGFIGVLIVCRIKKLKFGNVIDVLDSIAPGLILAQSIGRWGNFVNQEAYGAQVLDLKLQFFPYAVFIEKQNAWYQATFFYESFPNLIGFVLLFWLALKLKGKYKGIVTSGYFVFYGIVRSIVEGMRSDSLYNGAIRVSQALSVVFVIMGVAMAYFAYKYADKLKAEVPEKLKYTPKQKPDKTTS